MKHFKTLLYLLLAVVLLLPLNPINAYAYSDEKDSHLYINADEVSSEATDYANNNYNDVIGSLPDVIIGFNEPKEKIYYGKGFVFNEISYFPIICDKK